MANIQDILMRVKQELSAGLPFMEGREQGAIVTGIEFTVKEFGMLKDKEQNDREYACFLLEEDNEHFFFGGSVITETFQTLQRILSDEELKQLLDAGLRVKFEKKVSTEKNREYMTMDVL